MKNASLVCVFLLSASLFAQQSPTDRVHIDCPDGHAPLSITNDHTHQKGELMFSYRFGTMNGDGLIQGSQTYSDKDAFTKYKAFPQDMYTNMNMVGAMYGVTDQLTLMAMADYLTQHMDMKTKAGKNFSNQTEGFGSVYLGFIYKVFDAQRASFSAYVGLHSTIKGKIAQYGKNAAGQKMKLPYNMDVSSGTSDLAIGTTYKQQWDLFSLGIQPGVLLRIGKNSEGYRLGNLYEKADALQMNHRNFIVLGLQYTLAARS